MGLSPHPSAIGYLWVFTFSFNQDLRLLKIRLVSCYNFLYQFHLNKYLPANETFKSLFPVRVSLGHIIFIFVIFYNHIGVYKSFGCDTRNSKYFSKAFMKYNIAD